MKAIITVDVPEHQIGQEVSVYFKDTMCVKSVCTPLTESDDCVSRADLLEMIELMTDIKGNTVYVVRDSDIRKMPSVQPNQEKHDEEIIKETVESIWGKPPYTDMLDAIESEILDFKENCNASNYLGCGILDLIDKYRK